MPSSPQVVNGAYSRRVVSSVNRAPGRCPTSARALLLSLSVVMLLGGLATLSHAQVISRPAVPEKIRAPAGETLVLVARASGSQIYVCQRAASPKDRPRWTLKAPDAQLHDRSGAVIGHHYAGPTWQHADGSKVSGHVAAQVDSPEAASIPWLLITATDHSGTGVFTAVNSIQRIHTKGGQPPPASACNASTLDAEKRSSYTADYYFYAAAK